MTDIKMVATDIDGTILSFKNKEFTPAVTACVKKLADEGVKVILITGRMHKSAKKISDKLNLDAPIVSYQGALVRDNTKDENILYERYIDNNIAQEILDWTKKNGIDTNLYLNDELYVESENECTRRYTGEQHVPYHVTDFDNLKIDKVNKILVINYDDENIVSEWKEYLTKKYPHLFIVKSTPYFCEVCHCEATKGDGLRFLQKYYGISKEETLTIGDHNNDVELLKAGGVKVAMGNASEDLKAVADYITDTVDNDGFVRAIEKFVMRGAHV